MSTLPPATSSPRPIPGPRSLPIIGDALSFLRDPLGYLVRMRQQYGAVVQLPLPIFRPLFINDPALLEQVLVTDNKSYSKDVFLRRLARETVGQGLLTSEGDFWRRQRRLAQPAFHRERIAEYAGIMTRLAMEYVDTLRPGQEIDLHEDMMRLTLQIVAQTLFSAEVDDMATTVGQALDAIMSRYADGLLMLFPSLSRLPLPVNRRFQQGLQQLDALLYGLIQKRREEGVHKGDLLSMLLQARDEDGSAMTDTQLRDEVITLFTAGHETTALLLSFTFMLLSVHPEAAAKLGEELGSVLAGRAPTLADVPALRYTEAVVLESMRLYPPAWSLGREALRDTEIGGYPVPRGTQVWMSAWVMHRDPAYYPQPEAFQPERWLDGLQRRLPRFAYFPFGGGPRICIGNTFAMTEAILLLACIASRYRMSVKERPPLKLLPSITLRPLHGLHARCEPAPRLA